MLKKIVGILAFFLVCGSVFSKDLISGDEKIIGSFKKQTDGSFLNVIATELLKESSDRDERFKDLDLEISIPFRDLVKASVRYSRRVNSENPKTEGDEVGPTDYAKYRVTNGVYTRLDTNFEWFNFGTNRFQVGQYFAVSNLKVPRDSKLNYPHSQDSLEELCERANEWTSPLLPEIREKLSNNSDPSSTDNCLASTKGFKGFVEDFVDVLNVPLHWILNNFSDSEKMKIYADKHAEPVTNYSRYGLPIDVDAFKEGNPLLSVGDIVQSTLFLREDPLSYVPDLIPGFSTKITPFSIRWVKDTRVEKKSGNKALLQITSYIEKGSEVEFLKFRASFLFIFKYTLANWEKDVYNRGVSRRVYEIDLSSEKAKQFLKDKLSEIKPKIAFSLDKEEELRESLEEEKNLPQGVTVAAQPLFHYDSGSSYVEMARFPGLFKFFSKSDMKIVDSYIGNRDQQTSLEIKHKEESKIDLQFKFLDFLRTDKNAFCEFNTSTYVNNNFETAMAGLVSNKLAMNLDCLYSKDYSTQDDVMRVIDTNLMLFDSPYNEEFRYRLASLNFKDFGKIEYGFNLSLNWDQMEKVVEKLGTQEAIYLELVSLVFGDKYRAAWERTGYKIVLRKIGEYSRGNYRTLIKSYVPENCGYNGAAVTSGAVKPSFGLEELNLRGNECSKIVLKYFRRIATHLQKLTKTVKLKERFDHIASTYPDMHSSVLLGRLLQRLALDNSKEQLLSSSESSSAGAPHYSFSFDSDILLGPIQYTNGEAYRVSHQNIKDPIADLEYIRDSGVRITNAILKRPLTDSNPKFVRLDVFSTHKFDPSTRIELQVQEFETFKDKVRSVVLMELPAPEALTGGEGKINGVSPFMSIPGGLNGAKYVYRNIVFPVDEKWRKNRKHVLQLRMVNPEGEWLSEEAEMGFNW